MPTIAIRAWRGDDRAAVQSLLRLLSVAGASRIDLTAGDGKDAGRALYESLGFHERDTSCFRMLIQPT